MRCEERTRAGIARSAQTYQSSAAWAERSDAHVCCNSELGSLARVSPGLAEGLEDALELFGVVVA